MARPFLNTFEKDSPMTPQSAAANISYQANVSRQKTKKWAEAKAVDYGGDDWGDDDEYGYDPPPPPPAATKPTGPRQQAPATSSTFPITDSNRRYGDLSPLPGASASGRGRSNSFDADDERRNFSSSTIRQPSPPRSNAPSTRFSQITGVPTIRNASGPPALSISTQQPNQSVPQQRIPDVPRSASSYTAAPPYPAMPSQSRVNTSEAPPITSSDSNMASPSTARDFSPSAVVAPLTTRAPISNQSPIEVMGTRFPARKSSLSQVTGPPLEEIMQGSGQPSRSIVPDSSPIASPRSPISPDKALPFVRPADIYKRRMEEEQERKRSISMESGRPSMDSVAGMSNESFPSPEAHQLRHKGSFESMSSRKMSNDSDVATDSGRRLNPMLDTVQERRSEYGLEGLVNNEREAQNSSQTASLPSQVDSNEPRNLSVSPKLPDLNRISRFGMDMFSHPHETSAKGMEHIPINASTSSDLSRSDPDPTLRTQPSFGFRSVVSQAFDSAEPETPASASVKRSDSESTGTTGISPIISRASSSAVAGSRHPELSILEVVNEPNSPESTHEVVQKTQQDQDFPGFKMGHRRDISAPSPGNSPARTPDLGVIPMIIPSEQHAEVDITSPTEPSSNSDEGLYASRPVADREASFRPSLPGGWTSYATTEVPSRSISRKQTPAPQTTQDPSEEEELTPTTTKQWLPQSEFNATIIGEGREHNPSESNSRPSLGDSRHASLHDRDIEPMETSYSAAASDPSTLPKLEQAPAETQLRPDMVSRGISNNSSVAPTPPPKDTPRVDSFSSNAGYFENTTVPLKQHSSHEDSESDGEWDSPTREAIPIIHTGTPPSDDENEILRQEIVKSLSPRPSDATRQEEALVLNEVDDSTYDAQGRESTYLPSEYDNYWASTEDNRSPSTAAGSRQMDKLAIHDPDATQIAPLSPQRSIQASLEPPRPSLQSRFSWEGSAEQVPTVGQNIAIEPETTFSSSTSMPSNELPGQDVEAISELGASSQYHPTSTTTRRETWGSSNEAHSVESPSDESRAIGIGAGVAAASGLATAAYAHQQTNEPQRRQSLAEEKNPLITSTSYPVSPTPPEDEHPSRSPHPHLPVATDSFSPPPPSTISPVDTPIQQHATPANKLIAFKDIMAMSSQEKRIETFNSTRQCWASIDPGLNDWIERLQVQSVGHADVVGAWSGPRTSAPASSVRSKFHLPGGGAAPPLQQPYYQQYLNASPTTTSPTTPTTAGPAPGSTFQSSSQQGFAPGSSKLTTQQVQAKSKEFLHTAGIFGGKAGQAGKGLFLKGKNRLRGAGSDKTDQASQPSSPPPSLSKPKNERRSSWGFPLSLSRSSKRDTSSRLSKDSTSTPTFQRSRAATTTSWDTSPAKGVSPPPTSQSHGFMSGALPDEPQQYSQPQAPISPPATVRQVVEESPLGPVPVLRSDEQDDVSVDLDDGVVLGIPAPISKDRPSWDAINAAPISEESSQFDEPPRVSSETRHLQPSLPVHVRHASIAERSNSDETHFYDANEEPAENSDWVMVFSRHESKDTLSKEEPIFVSNEEIIADPISSEASAAKEPEIRKDRHTPELEVPEPMTPPTTGIMNRPRGSIDHPLSSLSPQISRISSSGPSSREIPVATPRESIDLHSPAQISAQVPAPVLRVHDVSEQEAQRQNATSSFLPPIHRTSTFTLPFGPRHAHPNLTSQNQTDAITAPFTQIQSIPSSNRSIASDSAVSPLETVSPSAQYPSQKAPTDGLLQYPRANDQISPSNSQHQRVQSVPEPEATSALAPGQGTTPNGFVQNRNAGETMFPFHNRAQSLPENHPPQSSHQGSMWTNRPALPLPPAGSSSSVKHVPEQISQQEPQRAPLSTQKAKNILQQPEFTESHVEWRPSRPEATDPIFTPRSPSYAKEIGLPHRRINSWETGAEQEITREAPSHAQKAHAQEAQYDEKPVWAGPPSQQRPYEQPPSSAQRYPELFRPGQIGHDSARGSVDLPAQYYQAPIPRAAAFLPRQQTNEYQLQGVGPPEPPMTGNTRRNSGFFKDIGGKLSRTSSRERRSTSISRGEGSNPISHERQHYNGDVSVPYSPPVNALTRGVDRGTSRGNDYADSITPSETAQEKQKKRRSSLLGGVFNRSTSGINTPASRESIIAHNGASRSTLLSPPPTPPSSDVKEEKKKSLFGSSNLGPRPKNGKLGKGSAASTGTADSAKRRNRFSSLSSIFGGRPSQSARTGAQHQSQVQSTRELAQNERQPLESPILLPAQPKANKSATPVVDNQSAGQHSNGFSNLSYGAASPSSLAYEKKSRRPSASGLLGGLMGRKSDRGSQDSRSQGSTSNHTVRLLQLSQTYSDLDDEAAPASIRPPQAQPALTIQHAPNQAILNQHIYGHRTFDERFPDPKLAVQPTERGRRASNEQQRQYVEPQYDSVPIPGGYSLVHGHGATGVHTNYDPRGVNQQQGQDARLYGHQLGQNHQQNHQNQIDYPQNTAVQSPFQPRSSSLPQPFQQASMQNRQQPTKLDLKNISAYQDHLSNSPHLSREDLLARSPPQSVVGQQRPYQLSLPGGDEDDEDLATLPLRKDPMHPSSSHPVAKAGRGGAIQRLQQPTLRHPESPAGYPLPADTVFSPINPGVNDIPPPPPPKWPSSLDQHMREQQSQIEHVRRESMDLDRSNTRRTAVSAISSVSREEQTPVLASYQNGLNVPGQENQVGNGHGRGRAPSLSPPSPLMRSPERSLSPESGRAGPVQANNIRRTDVHVPERPTSSDDLYDASPRLPKSRMVDSGNAMTIQTANLGTGREVQEEKIHYAGGRGEGLQPGHGEEDERAGMSATSYPGQEWIPESYMAGGWDDGYD